MGGRPFPSARRAGAVSPAESARLRWAKAGDAALSSFTWNEMVFRSFQAGFLKKLDLDFYRSLKLATAKRMYRFLDKRFHFSGRLRFSLPVFACEHLGLSRSYDTAQLSGG